MSDASVWVCVHVCVCACVCMCVRVCVSVVRVWCMEGSWTDRSDKTMAGFEPGKRVELGVWVGHLDHFLYSHGKGDKKVGFEPGKRVELDVWAKKLQVETKKLQVKMQKTQRWPCTGLFMDNLEIKVWNSPNWTNCKKETCMDPPIYQLSAQ